MSTFDNILPAIQSILHDHAAALPEIGDLIINRDLNGRVRLIAQESTRENQQAMQALGGISKALLERLGNHAYPLDRAILFEDNLKIIYEGATKFKLAGFDKVQIIDRLASEGDWARISAESVGSPRIVFFSIKGGVGRSTALAASAWSLAQIGKRVLVIDLDLESPGLSSALLPEDRRPTYGITDWLVEDLVNNSDSVFSEMIATSELSYDGEIYVVPAHGREPGEYVAKLGRAWMPKISEDGKREAWSQRLARLIQALENKLKPDVILLDSRAGIDEIASSCIADLSANLVLLFAIDGEQTWAGYRILFNHWRRYGVAHDIRERLQTVGAMIPELGTAEYFDSLCEHSYDLHSETLYDEIAPGELIADGWHFDVSDDSAPHYPWAIRWHRGFIGFRSLHLRLNSIDPQDVSAIFGDLIDNMKRFVSQER